MPFEKNNRTRLKSYFVKNAIPTEQQFAELMDGMLIQGDDGIVKPANDPLSIEASGDQSSQKKALHFYDSFTDAEPAWVLSLNPRQEPNNPATARRGLSIGDSTGTSRLFIDRASGNVGIGTLAPDVKLTVAGGLRVLSDGNPINFTARWSATPDAVTDTAEISNDTNSYKTLMIIGNRSAGRQEPGRGRRVSIWDILEVNGDLAVTRNASVNGKLDVNGGALLGYETTITDFGAVLKSGFYQNGGQEVTGDVPDTSHAWSHLITVRHSNTGNNHQLQIASTYAENDRLFFRKIAGGNAARNPAWMEIATRHKLDIEDSFTATVRCADFKMGHSSRSNRQGRALVDNTNVLAINWNGDWPGGVSIWQVGWETPALLNTWVYYGNPYNPPGYFKDSCGIVHLRGLVKSASGIGKVIFVLPAGYRPAYRQLHVSCTNPNASGRLDVETNGNVLALAGDAGWFSLDGISFRAA
jgi:hypothetical protein